MFILNIHTNCIAKFLLVLSRTTTAVRGIERITRWPNRSNSSPDLISGYNMRILQTDWKISIMQKMGISPDSSKMVWFFQEWYVQLLKSTVTYNFNSSANESNGDNVPDVKMMDPTPNPANSSMATPGLKHHQLNVLVAFANTERIIFKYFNLKAWFCSVFKVSYRIVNVKSYDS